MTAATPMMTPSMVKPERILLAFKPFHAVMKLSNQSIMRLLVQSYLAIER